MMLCVRCHTNPVHWLTYSLCGPCVVDAIATEARRAETVKLGSVHEGAGLVEASPNTSPKTCAS